MKRFDLESTSRPSVTLVLIDDLLRPGRVQFRSLPQLRFLWRQFEPLVLAKPVQPKTLQTKAHHLTVGSLGAGRLIKPVEELIAWAIEKGRITANPVLRKTIAKTALLDRPLHLLFFDEPAELVYHSIFAIANMAAAQGIERIVLHPCEGGSSDAVAQLTSRLSGVRVGRLTDIENFDTLIFLNFAPYTHESWLEQFLNARPDLSNINAVVLAGEPTDDRRLSRAFPSPTYDSTLPEVLLAHERSQQRFFPSSQSPHIPYYFNGLRRMQLGVTEQTVSDADTFAKIFEDILRKPAHFNLMSVDSLTIKLGALDRLLAKFTPSYTKSGGALLVISGVADQGSVLSGVLADRALQKNLVRAALADHYGLANVGRPHGVVSDVAPTILKLLGLPIPYQMTGRPLI